jgi:hypothetical protein
MAIKPVSTAIVPYTTYRTPMEFIQFQIAKGITNGTIVVPIGRLLPSPLISFPKIHIKFGINLLIKDLKSPTIDIKTFLTTPRTSKKSLCNTDIKLTFDASEYYNPTIGPRSITRRTVISAGGYFLYLSGMMYDRKPREPFSQASYPNHFSSRPQRNGEEIAEALQSELAVTIATDKKPIVASYGAGPCVIVGGYESINKIAFVVHFSNAREIRKDGGEIFYSISKWAKASITTPIQIHLRGGKKGSETSEATIKAIRVWMTQRKDLPMEIASEDILDNGCRGSKSLSIDSRNGTVSKYDPLTNPQHRKLDAFAYMAAITNVYNPKITLAYSPKV